MDAMATSETQRSPRWWRRFIVASRRANVFLVLEIFCALALLLAIWSTWFAFSTAPPNGQLLPSAKVAVLLIGTLIPAMALLVLLGRRLALRRAAGSTARLHVRLVFFFSMVAAVPTLLVAAFAAFLFQSGVDFWFSDDSRGLMENTRQLADTFYEQNQLEVAQETVTMAGDLRYYLDQLDEVTLADLADQRFVDVVAFQMQGRDLSETVILQRVEGDDMRVAAAFNVTEGNDPTGFARASLAPLAAGEAVNISASPNRIEALAAIDPEGGIYLYNSRNSEADLFTTWERAKSISSAYDTLASRARALQLRFNLALFVVSLALVGLAVWFALRFADRQVEPLTELVGAARKVGAGNFALRVSGRTGADEIGLLNRAFNRMTAQLEKQTDALVSANRQIDDRRAFTEAVLESVTSGVISLDGEGRVQLINGSAQTLLIGEGGGSPVGRNLASLSPQIAQLAESGVSSGVVTHQRGEELLTLAVKLAPEKGGQVITFEDITRQLLDQRQAAWSDVARRIAHEIKNPLTPIQLATERLNRRYRKQIEIDGELFDELTGTIIRQVGDLRKMVDEFSSFARLPKPNFRQEDAVDLLRQALFLQEVAHPQVDFALSLDEVEDPIISCDRHQVGQAMTNVLKNAVEAVEARAQTEEPDYRGRIGVKMESSDTMLTVTVEDNGVGLPQERERITEPYMTTREKGTGLGLAIVNKIVDEHGGDMTFSTNEAGGTRVVLRLARDPLEHGAEDKN
ncbi:two-component system, NtrC family, nitrogen regulation sensor histidine kinase NtrY [Altererythrobacter xiamenensis]|uniref:histidine kinase n=1 Tax=Altererythrobacter xiamenensis TaxID=1316679 RepID=A0A1Y6FM31_9SPHN|nr:two-component system, NtrC family, nitrogen regulation sensor histidine kinase NtrY [Altererythrobacter xiamenensis]